MKFMRYDQYVSSKNIFWGFGALDISVWCPEIWTSIFCFQETGVLEELGGFERHWDVRRKNLLPVVRLFLGRVPVSYTHLTLPTKA